MQLWCCFLDIINARWDFCWLNCMLSCYVLAITYAASPQDFWHLEESCPLVMVPAPTFIIRCGCCMLSKTKNSNHYQLYRKCTATRVANSHFFSYKITALIVCCNLSITVILQTKTTPGIYNTSATNICIVARQYSIQLFK